MAAPTYAHAFDCAACPGCAGPEGCPAWWELVEESAAGETRITRGCGLVLLPRLMVEVIKAANRPAAAVESCRNEIATGLAGIAAGLPGAVMAVAAIERRGGAHGILLPYPAAEPGIFPPLPPPARAIVPAAAEGGPGDSSPIPPAASDPP